jgi:hypothetical protein
MKLRLQDSIYQQKKAGPGLVIEDGMLINNRPNSRTGIQKAVEVKKSIHKAEKVQMMAEAVFLGNIRSEMMEGPEMG